MSRIGLRTPLTAAWAALHTTQYGFAISSLNGIQGPLTCGAAGGQVGPHLVNEGWLQDCVRMTPAQFGLVVSIFTLGGLSGSLGATTVNHRLGRVGTLRVSALAVLLGSTGVALSNTVATMIAARILIGLGCGLATVTVPLVLSEVAPPSMKRSLGIMNQIFIVLGMLISQSLSFPFAKPLVWRYVLSVSVGLAVLQLIGSFLVEEPKSSPNHSSSGDIESEIDEQTSLLNVGGTSEKPLTIKELLTSQDPQVTRGLLVVLVTQLSQQLCGVSPVMYFSTRILTPVFQSNSRLIALFMIIIKLPVTTLPAFLIERTGTRPLLLYPTVLMSLAALLLAFGINYDAQLLSVVAVFSFVIAFSMGLGPVAWVVLPEVMPNHAVTAAGSVGIALNWTANFCMGAAFLPVQQWLSGGKESAEGNIFFVIAVTCLLATFAMRLAFTVRDRVAL